jgi:DUF4097 and DUF4098 domain-containing protein YvlB
MIRRSTVAAFAAVCIAAVLLLPPLCAADPTKSFSVSKGGSLTVVTSVGDVTLRPWEKNEVLVETTGIPEDELDRLRMTQTGNAVRVEFRPTSSSHGQVRFIISLPSQFDVDLSTAGGDILVEGALTGVLKGSTAGGDVRVGDLSGRADLKTSGGDITAGRVRGDADLKTSGGDIRVVSADGQVNVSTSGGDIEVGDVGKALKASTAGGDIKVGNVGGEATLSTAGGDVRVGKVSGTATLKTAGGDVECNGATGPVVAKTAGGDLRLSGISGSIEAATAGGDIRAELNPTGSGPSSLTTAGGSVSLYLPENAKATVQALIRIEGRWKTNSARYDIRSDFKAAAYTKDEDAEEIRASYELNGGGQVITVKTVNGDIQIRKAGALPAERK